LHAQPKGRGYNEAQGQLMKHYGLDQLDKTSASAVLCLTDPADKYGPSFSPASKSSTASWRA
jgi:hypothetical protein